MVVRYIFQGMGTRILGNPHDAISKIVSDPARATTTVAIPADMRSASVLRSP